MMTARLNTRAHLLDSSPPRTGRNFCAFFRFGKIGWRRGQLLSSLAGTRRHREADLAILASIQASASHWSRTALAATVLHDNCIRLFTCASLVVQCEQNDAQYPQYVSSALRVLRVRRNTGLHPLLVRSSGVRRVTAWMMIGLSRAPRASQNVAGRRSTTSRTATASRRGSTISGTPTRAPYRKYAFVFS